MSTPGEPSKPSLIFFGTPEFAVPSLRSLIESGAFSIRAVVTQPDKPAGRGQRLTPPPIKQLALEHALPVYQPVSLKKMDVTEEGQRKYLRGEKSGAQLAEFLNSIAPIDVGVSVAYGKIIPSVLLQYPRRGVVNIHPSLLPRWRGAAPLQRALFSGDTTTGVTLMQVDDGLDTGPVYCVREVSISEGETMGTLHDKLAELSGEILIECLPQIVEELITPTSQSDEGVTYAEKWDHQDMKINWSESAEVTLRRIRTCSPFPGTRASLGGMQVKIFAAHQVPDQNFPTECPGTVVDIDKAQLIVTVGSGEYVAIDEMQFPGKKRLPIAEIMRGKSLHVGDRFE